MYAFSFNCDFRFQCSKACQEPNQVPNHLHRYCRPAAATEYHSPFFSCYLQLWPKSPSCSIQPLPTVPHPKYSLLLAIHPNQHAHLPPHCPLDCKIPPHPTFSLLWSNLLAQLHVQSPCTDPKNSDHVDPKRYAPTHDTTFSESSCNPYIHQKRRSITATQ